MPTTNAIRLLLIITFLLLVGCESGFDKCMNTELPRAEKIAGLKAEREAGLKLIPMRKHLVNAAETEILLQKNVPQPTSLPKYPSFKCIPGDPDFSECYSDHKVLALEWMKLPENVSWNDRRDQERLRLHRERGYSFDSMHDLNNHFYELHQKFNNFVIPRSASMQRSADSDFREDTDDETWWLEYIRAFDEAVLTNASTITELAEKSKELAAVTCNNHGFYE